MHEQHLQTFAKLLATTPDATAALPLAIQENQRHDVTAIVVFEMLSRLRRCMCKYEISDDAPFNDGVPFSIAFFSWCVRMLSYAEPSYHQKMRGLYFAVAGAQRLLLHVGLDMGPVATGWMDQFRTLWQGQNPSHDEFVSVTTSFQRLRTRSLLRLVLVEIITHRKTGGRAID